MTPDEREWLRDHGVQIDAKGRVIVRLPKPDADPPIDDDSEQPSIAELMRHEIDRRTVGSRGRRRRTIDKSTSSQTQFPAERGRIGRPPIGTETRIAVQTSIAPHTRHILQAKRMTLAQVFDACVRELAHVP